MGERYMSRLAFQPEFRPALPTSSAVKDYQVFSCNDRAIDDYLVRTGMRIVCSLNTWSRLIKERSSRSGANIAGQNAQLLCDTTYSGNNRDSFRAIAIRAQTATFSMVTYTIQWMVSLFSKRLWNVWSRMFTDEQITSLIHNANRVLADKQAAR